ncbi:MAG: response regulator transcription factor [Lachnospiraceae bacterium]|nr:response regulator transcription factor [Lachnospiraceae bacterium]
MKRILLAEDNDSLRELISDYLTDKGYDVAQAADGLEGWELIQQEKFDLILLDVMMPRMDGFELCKKIREIESVPILFLTAKIQEQDQLTGYRLGADDYILKPFSLPVLYAKCQVILDRNKVMGDWIETGHIRLNEAQRKVLASGKEIKLQSLDFELLNYLMNNRGRILTREQILVKLWGYDYEGSDRAVDTHIKKLRKALGNDGNVIKTVIKQGYVLEA